MKRICAFLCWHVYMLLPFGFWLRFRRLELLILPYVGDWAYSE